ncbi:MULTISPECIES: ABC transporter ATP-binding protein [Streptococcus]|jgi:ATP-binding cassette protein|uniref:ATP-binding cassette protein n=2 Tax=Streptococcus gordonii TaxID=1302 RepID=A8AY39_STRGC|nr:MULTISPECIES: ATP-binding cassette domain-containing protein [Streptococcus]ABV10684.1 ATP-binding cassette protein [Streptococcus gordonii str. Challis substr. CH1]AOS71820.1 macrolide ABC transporter ATP-binding protein [Streptococcus gordonii]EEY79948.1 putative bacteriocin export ABC transporter, lactococcin 972 group [Streptococcus sp. 2_1_36FAA]KJQ58994.1 ABC transporter ATP-binding protein [Streptococcus gordonii]KTF20891.1 macrolide ABC transporter ATP-binding protein [Streptococcus
MLKLKEIHKSYQQGSQEFPILKGIDLHVKEGDFLAIMGPSGSGKSTLMNIIGCLDKANAGSYHIEGTDVSNLSDNQLSDLRNQKIGFVFQNFNLMPKLTACQNVELPLTYMKIPKKERRERAMEMLRLVGLEERSEFKPMELSGGQKQRVAIARALVTNPSFILGDEPTGALDTKTSVQIMELFKQFNEAGKTIVIITHEPEVAQMCKKTVVLRDGNIEHKEVERN